MVENLLMLQVLLAEDILGYWIVAPSRSETSFSAMIFSVVYDDLQHDLAGMTDNAVGSVALAQLQVAFLWGVITRSWVHVVGHSQFLLQIEVRMHLILFVSKLNLKPAWFSVICLSRRLLSQRMSCYSNLHANLFTLKSLHIYWTPKETPTRKTSIFFKSEVLQFYFIDLIFIIYGILT